jgi:hypothetical protein
VEAAIGGRGKDDIFSPLANRVVCMIGKLSSAIAVGSNARRAVEKIILGECQQRLSTKPAITYEEV